MTLGATTIRTALSRTVIDVNRDPSGASLYPGQTTTGLCPLETFDGEPLYKSGSEPGPAEIAAAPRRVLRSLSRSTGRRAASASAREFGCVVLYDAHSIRSRVPRLFDGELPQFNIGTNNGASCDPALTAAIEKICDASAFSQRHQRPLPRRLDHAPLWQARRSAFTRVQMELAMRGYLHEPEGALTSTTGPRRSTTRSRRTLRVALRDILDACLAFANPDGVRHESQRHHARHPRRHRHARSRRAAGSPKRRCACS